MRRASWSILRSSRSQQFSLWEPVNSSAITSLHTTKSPADAETPLKFGGLAHLVTITLRQTWGTLSATYRKATAAFRSTSLSPRPLPFQQGSRSHSINRLLPQLPERKAIQLCPGHPQCPPTHPSTPTPHLNGLPHLPKISNMASQIALPTMAARAHPPATAAEHPLQNPTSHGVLHTLATHIQTHTYHSPHHYIARHV